MPYEIGLLFTAIIYGWVVGDLLLARGWRRRFPGIALAAAAIAVWAVGEFFVRHAISPEEVLAGRRILFLGVCALGPLWIWGVGQATQASWLERWPYLPVLLALPEAFAYSTLYWDASGLFVHPTAVPPQSGPLFLWHAAFTWLLLGVGFVALERFFSQMGSGGRVRWILAVAAGLPFVANAIYVLGGVPESDPTPLVLGAVGLGLRFVLLETGLAPYYLPFARREVIEQIPAGLLVADAGDRIVDANQTARELLALEEPVGMPLAEVVARARSHPLRAIEVESSTLERRGVRFGTALLLEDRTEVRMAERRLELATRFEAMGFLISGVAHEVNNPLAYVRGNLGLIKTLTQALEEEPELVRQLPAAARRIAREADSILGDAIEGADRIAALIRRLGTFAPDQDREEPRELELALTVRRAMELAGMGRATDLLQITHEDELPALRAREEDLVQVLLQLLINAVQAAGKVQPIEVEMRNLETGIEVRVLDRGPGVPPDLLPHVFDPFFSTKDGQQHVGLGLSLAYDLARQNGGELEANPRMGGGIVFTLRFPPERAAPNDPQG